ncbi:MAG TPA: MBL fold metallo-hydrolase [Gemmatimonadales bacterium]|nr:MBL fold metallo-hydrolase [Gemmatimonadales bacterium]
MLAFLLAFAAGAPLPPAPGLLTTVPVAALPTAPPTGPAPGSVKVTVLSTMLTDLKGVGEWGFAALVEVGDRRYLFDTGERPETVLKNAEELGLDLSTVTDVILSHHHWDHVGGLLTLRRAMQAKNPQALSRVHVAPGIFQRRLKEDGSEENDMPRIRTEYERTGGRFIEHAGPAELSPGVWITGPVPRANKERNWSPGVRLVTPNGIAEDTLPEDQALVVLTSDGPLVITGCGHAGIVNIMQYAERVAAQRSIATVVGGLHLFSAPEQTLAWTADHMRDAGVRYLLGAHCTGIEAVYRLRELAGLDRKRAVVGAVGSSYTSGAGLDPLGLAR